jgi:PPK2 family polyphosphate:nucleotide phosphotransferase
MKSERKKIIRFARDYRVDKGAKFRLKDFDPGQMAKLESKDEADSLLAASVKLMSEMQAKLYAQEKWSLLLIFQAMDAAGKDGTIKHVMSGINPQGCQVTSFKAPSSTDLRHGYLWRANAAMPERGKIGIFNRSYYEEVLVVRVHNEMLQAERIPAPLVTKHIWKERFEDINAHERYLTRNGVVIRKFFLHLSKAEQKKRFLSRLDEPSKNWKFSGSDLKERGFWDEYQGADSPCALVRRARGQQVVHPSCRRRSDYRCVGIAGTRLSGSDGRAAARFGRCAQNTGEVAQRNGKLVWERRLPSRLPENWKTIRQRRHSTRRNGSSASSGCDECSR